MALVGDVITSVREMIPDMPTTLPQPVVTITTVTATGSTLPAGTYAGVVTFLTPWGETVASAEIAGLAVGANVGVQVAGTLTPGTSKGRLYLTLPGGGAGAENQYIEFTALNFVASVPLTGVGTPPTRNTAYLPDQDGTFASGATYYRWLNRALIEMSRLTNGIRDYSGVPTVSGQPLYSLTGNWVAITDVWYNGYWMQGDTRGNFFRRNAITAAILTSASISVLDNRTVIEVFPQPDRTAGVTTLNGTITATATSLVSTVGGFLLLPFGFLQVDSEIMAYASVSGTTITGLLRGLGGTLAAAHANLAAVTELNLAINGRRTWSTVYTQGNAALTLPVPPGWEDILPVYMLHLVAIAEKERPEAERYLKQFGSMVAEWARQNQPVLKRRQIGAPSLPEVYYGGVPGAGGNIIP